ncbi:MAG: hypothetical protein JNK28_01440 [Burkholderiaceae bacterium]|nr:hypothetical protein [Burkholderiaceae bacterium]
MSQCLILETSWYDRFTSDRLQKVPPLLVPTVVQPDRETAEREALRLAREHPGKTFVVFQASVGAVGRRVPSHITLGGQVVREHIVTELADIEGDQDIPF